MITILSGMLGYFGSNLLGDDDKIGQNGYYDVKSCPDFKPRAILKDSLKAGGMPVVWGHNLIIWCRFQTSSSR